MELLIKNISKGYDGQIVLKNISFSVSEGGIFLIYGRNGSGKTTLLRILNLLDQPDSGEIIFYCPESHCFKRNTRRNLDIQRKMVFVPQKPVLFSGSVLDNILVGLKIRGRSIENKKIDNILQRFDLQQIIEKKTHQISAGQKQKVSLARSFILNCELILLDEPLNYLDEQGKQSLKNYIYEEVANGTSFVITTPDLKEWEDFSFDTSYLLKEGFLYDISSEGKADCMGYSESFTSRKN